MTEETGSAAVDAGTLEKSTFATRSAGSGPAAVSMPGAGVPEAGPAGMAAGADVDQTGAYDVRTGAYDARALGGIAPVRSGGQIAGYRVEAEIGNGGMATVYRALDVKLGRRVALKILAPRLAQDDSFRQRFIHESRAAAAVDHPNIVPVFEAGDAGGVLFIAMRYVGTGDVRTLLERQGSLPVDRAVAICAQVASALDAASAHGLVHRDVKPANMLLAESAEGRADHVYLSDFGLSKHSLAPSGLTATGQFMGTLDYVAPEQIEGRAVDGRADQYSLACAAVEMLTGAPPFRRDENIALMWAQLSESPPSLRERRPDLPEAMDRVMARALAKSPADRYPTCMDFAAALRAASVAQPPAGAVAPGVVRTPTEQARHAPRPPRPPRPARPTPGDPLARAADPAAAAPPARPPAQWGRTVQDGSLSDAPTDLGLGAPWGQGGRERQAAGTAPASAPASQSPVGTRPPAWGQSAAEAGQADTARPESALWGPGAQSPGAQSPGPAAPLGRRRLGEPAQSPGAQSSGTQSSAPASRSGSGQADVSGAQQAQSELTAPDARQAEVARQAALWGREAQPEPGASWGQAARLGQAGLSTAPASGTPAVPSASGNPAAPYASGNPAAPRASGNPAAPRASGNPAAPRASGTPVVPRTSGNPGAPIVSGNPDVQPTSGSPAVAPAAPVSYRPESPGAPSRRPAGSPWSASPWPASAAANPAPSVPQPGSPAPWSSPGLYRTDAPSPADRQVSPDLYRSARIPAPTAPRPPARRPPARRRRGPAVALGLAAGVVALLAAALGYKLLHHTAANSGTGPGAGPSTRTVYVAPPRTPPAVVKAYFAAIDQHDYPLAFSLGGKYTGQTYLQYKLGFAGTAHDTVRILGHSGDTVRAQIIARQKDGSRKVYRGTYTVLHGAIVGSRIRQVFPRLR